MKKLWKSEYFSIPNLLGYFRILLIPVYLVLYFRAESAADYLLAALVIGISGLTDCFDGRIARKYNMITEFGKILDPVADKLTQGALVISLTFRYPLMSYVLFVFLVKEVYMGVMGAVMLRKGKKMDGAQWCGKICTAVLYLVLFLLIIFPDIQITAANAMMLICIIIMLYSFISYIIFYYRMVGNFKKEHKRKRKAVIAGGVLIAAAYLVLGAILPYRQQPEVSEEFSWELNEDSFYADRVSCDRAMVINENQEALDERIRLIASAKERIILSTFAFRSDDSGKDVLAALLDAAERGVNIKILADGFNSGLDMDYNPYFYALSSKPNVEIKIYNKVNLLTPWTSMGRMHDKYVIADESAYILGGRNTFNYFLGDYKGNKNHDLDVLIYNTEGAGSASSIYQLKKYFYDIWELECCKLFHDSERLADKICVEKAANELRERYEELGKSRPELFSAYDYTGVTYPVDRVTLISNPTGIYPKEPNVFYTLTRLMKNAREDVLVHTPYVIANDAMYEAFEEIAENVPEFKLLTNSAVNNGNLFAAGDYLLNKGRLLQTGMDILEYEGGISYHSKCIAIDNDMSIIGSFNMDMRSAYLDTELMLAINSEALNADLRKKMSSYEDKAIRVIDEETYEEKEGMVKLDMPAVKLIKIKFIRFIVGWARFLL